MAHHSHDSLRDRTLNGLNGENLVNVASDGPLEKDFSNHQDILDSTYDSEAALKKMRTASSIAITPELFEKLYLSPQNRVKGDLRKTFGNPTPLALIGFLLSLHPLSMDLMGWRGAGGGGASGTGTYYFFGGLLMLLGSLGEWIIGNTFPFVVFGSFGAFWLGLAATLTPQFNAYGAYSTTSSAADGLSTVGFRSGFAFFYITMGIMCFVYLICSVRTNAVFFMIFLTLTLAFSCLSGAYFQANNGNTNAASRLTIAGGAFTFCTCIFGWWIFIAIMLASLDFPFSVPVGDLSTLVKGASERKKDIEKEV